MSLEKASEVICKKCMNIKKDEKVLVVTDSEMQEIGISLFNAASELSSDVDMIEKEVGEMHGEEPSKIIASKMKESDVVLIATTYSLSHTAARREACLAGTRIASMPTITKDIMERCIDIDYDKLQEVHDKLREKLMGSSEVRIETDKGTSVTLSVVNTRGKVAGLYHSKGDFGNLPTGEVDSGVRDVNGVIVIDASMSGLGKLESPLKLVVKDNYVVSVEGDNAEEFVSILDKAGNEAYRMAELGIGTNPNAIVTGNVLEDEKVLGTVHLAVGNDITYGGSNNVSLHLDGVMYAATVYIDGKKIINQGKHEY